ncbi:MAG: hypothetical protein PVG45_04495 [Gammaproteobacteria bacterium]|jgi:hypothetical protein
MYKTDSRGKVIPLIALMQQYIARPSMVSAVNSTVTAFDIAIGSVCPARQLIFVRACGHRPSTINYNSDQGVS